jgi:hypothetical protein
MVVSSIAHLFRNHSPCVCSFHLLLAPSALESLSSLSSKLPPGLTHPSLLTGRSKLYSPKVFVRLVKHIVCLRWYFLKRYPMCSFFYQLLIFHPFVLNSFSRILLHSYFPSPQSLYIRIHLTCGDFFFPGLLYP